MPAANAYRDPRNPILLVQVELDPRQLDAISITHSSVVGTMTLQQAYELLWALEATLRGDSPGTDDDEPRAPLEVAHELEGVQALVECAVAEGDPMPDDAPGVIADAVRVIRELADCGDPDCTHPGCGSAVDWPTATVVPRTDVEGIWGNPNAPAGGAHP